MCNDNSSQNQYIPDNEKNRCITNFINVTKCDRVMIEGVDEIKILILVLDQIHTLVMF